MTTTAHYLSKSSVLCALNYAFNLRNYSPAQTVALKRRIKDRSDGVFMVKAESVRTAIALILENEINNN